MSEPRHPPVQVVVCPEGPLLVRGAIEVVGETGEHLAADRPVVALCRCGKSSRAPWCDGTHKLLRRRRAASTPQEGQDD